jgi:hypothetical protein
MTLKSEGEKLTGKIKGRLGEFPLRGTISGNQIKFSYAANFQGQGFTLTFSGAVEKDSMKGAVDFGGFGSGNWSAKRVADRAIDISGAWMFTVETDQGTGSPEFTFKQEGEKLTGIYRGMFGEAPVEGKVTGNKIEFSPEGERSRPRGHNTRGQ